MKLRPLTWRQVDANNAVAEVRLVTNYWVGQYPATHPVYAGLWRADFGGGLHGDGTRHDTREQALAACEAHYEAFVRSLFED